jgi:hypothetical protein
MGDELTFTTQLDISATPTVMFTPVLSGFQVSDSTATGTLKRKDTHKVTVGLALQPPGDAALTSLTGYVFSGSGLSGRRVAAAGGDRTQALLLNRITGTATSRAEVLALHMVDQLKSRQVQLIPAPSQ